MELVPVQLVTRQLLLTTTGLGAVTGTGVLALTALMLMPPRVVCHQWDVVGEEKETGRATHGGSGGEEGTSVCLGHCESDSIASLVLTVLILVVLVMYKAKL